MSKLIEQYKHDIKSSIKSADTEEWLDTVFTRPIGYLWARLFNHFDIHPNVVTVLSMILGVAAAVFFAFDADTTRGFLLNLIGVLLLMWANFYDSADGQLARMTGKKTRVGRILDG
ncbi:MAG: CDP-alcohol phosphatidyltransferase family protein, partial [Bacteroidaceae bacterium]|nr:CDP-alcohol phosphatidyltransferase family protein [Bacteroidaceae bacterium]